MGRQRAAIAVLGLLTTLLAGCATLPPPASPPFPAPAAAKPNPVRFSQTGVASWYGPHLNHKRTADGERFDENRLTAAHRSLPLNTVVRVTNLANGRSVRVRINDRGPYAAGRIIDLSTKAARDLGMTDGGTARVRLEVFENDQSAAL